MRNLSIIIFLILFGCFNKKESDAKEKDNRIISNYDVCIRITHHREHPSFGIRSKYIKLVGDSILYYYNEPNNYKLEDSTIIAEGSYIYTDVNSRKSKLYKELINKIPFYDDDTVSYLMDVSSYGVQFYLRNSNEDLESHYYSIYPETEKVYSRQLQNFFNLLNYTTDTVILSHREKKLKPLLNKLNINFDSIDFYKVKGFNPPCIAPSIDREKKE